MRMNNILGFFLSLASGGQVGMQQPLFQTTMIKAKVQH